MNEIKDNIVNFLTEWSACSNRCTGFPYYWTVADEKETYLVDNHGEFVFDYNSGSIRSIESILREMHSQGRINLVDVTLDELIDQIGFAEETELITDLLETYLENDITRYTILYETYHEGVFLTEKDAEEYLESCRNHHFGPNPRVYLDSFNKWGRHSRTEDFLKNLFKYFDVPIPPELYRSKD